MFTGLVKEKGLILRISPRNIGMLVTVDAPGTAKDLAVGDSVAVNGVCLTVVARQGGEFTVEATAETLRVSNLGRLRVGEKVNLEPALRFSDRLGGHLVTGHVDGTGRLVNKRKQGEAVVLEVELPRPLLKYICRKGSIALDGVSLTVAELTGRVCRVVIIPHTGAVTTLLEKKPGEILNIECDCLAKYVESILLASDRGSAGRLTREQLEEAGFR